MTLSTATPIYRKTSVQHGLDADKPSTPQAGDEYLATDTQKMYVCYTAGVWQNATPIIPGYAESIDPIVMALTQSFQLSYDVCRLELNSNANGFGLFISTSNTPAGVTEENILSAGHRIPANSGIFKELKRFENGIVKRNKILYVYRYGTDYATLADLVAGKTHVLNSQSVHNALSVTKPLSLKPALTVIE